MGIDRPYVLTIAGFDPSGGAGVLADIKTFEQFNCMGMAVLTANTIQTEDEFEAANWVEKEIILDQLKMLLDRYDFNYAKIGIVENLAMMKDVLTLLKENNVRAIWDPVIETTSGHILLKNLEGISSITSNCELITPNIPEFEKILETTSLEDLQKSTTILLKGGHGEKFGLDRLYINDQEVEFEAESGSYSEIHGSGCILSAAITAQLALGHNIREAIKGAKRYIEQRLNKNQGLLSYT
jgi:hydroxymethylpyrimidine/phosphomethylpyrimidine kinase